MIAARSAYSSLRMRAHRSMHSRLASRRYRGLGAGRKPRPSGAADPRGEVKITAAPGAGSVPAHEQDDKHDDHDDHDDSEADKHGVLLSYLRAQDGEPGRRGGEPRGAARRAPGGAVVVTRPRGGRE